MRPEIVRRALLTTGLKPQTSRLLAYMTDVATDACRFYEKREKTAHNLGMHPDTIKAALSELIALEYVQPGRAAVKGKRPREVLLMPHNWAQPSPVAHDILTDDELDPDRRPVTRGGRGIGSRAARAARDELHRAKRQRAG